MAKPTTPRHSKTTRKPVTIDLDPSDVKPVEKSSTKAATAKTTIPAAEPVGDFADIQDKSPETMVAKPAAPVQSEMKPEAQPAPKPDMAVHAAQLSRPASSSENDGSKNYTAGKTMNSPREAASTPRAGHSARFAGLGLAGLAGGLIVLLGATALQWSGIGLFAGGGSDTALRDQVATLEQQVNVLKSAPVPEPDAALLARITAAEQEALQAKKQLNELAQGAGQSDEIAALQAQIKALQENAGKGDGVNIEVLAQRLTDMETKLNNANAQVEQASAALTTRNDAVTTLKDQLAKLQERLDKQATQPDMAAIIAVNALKAAIDCGSSYSNELRTLVTLAPQQGEAAKKLETFAETGLPTLNQLNTQFTVLADKMVAIENKPAADAGIWDQLVGSAKGLIASRPVGDVPGDNIGFVTARIEYALQNGDAERAVAEWTKLPDTAKLMGQDFYTKLLARRDADALLTSLIANPAAKSSAQ